MPKGVYERKPKDDSMASETAAKQPSQMFPVLLIRNYVPRGEYEIVGYLKEAVKRKDAGGTWRVVEPEEFVEGEMKPHQTPGVGFADKIWAGTQVKLPLDEAKQVVSKKIAERADVIAA